MRQCLRSRVMCYGLTAACLVLLGSDWNSPDRPLPLLRILVKAGEDKYMRVALVIDCLSGTHRAMACRDRVRNGTL